MPHIQINLDSDDLRNPDHMQKLVAMFQALQGSGGATLAYQGSNGPFTLSGGQVGNVHNLPRTGPIVPDDNPATGIPAPSEAFGVGNAAAGSAIASLTSHARTGACSTNESAAQPTVSTAETVALPSPAAAFAPLVPAPQPGAPSLPPVTPTMPQPGAIAPPPVSPIPPAPAPAPAAAPAPAGSTSPVPGVELDAEGLPWDVRIHASSKEKIANGTWKLKRGVGNQVVWLNQIKDELRRALGNAPAAPAAAPNPAWPFPIPGKTTSPTASPPATPAPAASDTSTITMARLLPRVTAALDQGRLTADQAGQICAQVSGGAVTNVAMLAVRPDLIPHVWGQLDAMGIPQ